MRKNLPVFLLAAVLSAVFAAEKAAIPDTVKSRLSKLLPPPSELAASASGKPRFYAADLYEYINGGAEAFHNYDMAAMVHHEYAVKDAEITVDIYDMGGPLNAFGVYSAERSPEYNFIAIGTEGHVSESALNFLQGPFYVKLSAFSRKSKTAPLLEAFAQNISRRIGTGKSMPAILSIFPAQNLVARSQKYIKQAPLGHDFLAPAYMAAYSFGGKESTLVLSQAKDAQEAKQRVQSLASHFARTGKVAPRPGSISGAYRGSSRLEGDAIFFCHGAYTIVFVNPPANPDAFLKEFVARIAGLAAKPS